MADGFGGDAVDQLAIELVADGEAFLKSYRDTLGEALDETDKFGQEFADRITQAMAGASDQAIGQAIAEAAAQQHESIAQAVDDLETLGVQTGKTKEELVGLAQAYSTDVGQQLSDSINSAINEIQTLGNITPETTKALIDLSNAQLRLTTTSEQLVQVQQAQGMVQKFGTAPAQEGKGFGDFLNNQLDGVMKYAQGIVGVVGAYKLLSDAQRFLDESFASAVKLSEINFRLEVAVRAQQRAHGDAAGTIKTWNEFADQMAQKYGILNDKSRELVGTVNQLSLQLGLNQDQMKKLTEASITMGIATGRDAEGMLTSFVMFLNTGYGRTLARMGIDVSAAAQQQEALALGITKPSKQWTEQEKVMIRMTLLMKQLSAYQEDAGKQSETLAGRLQKANQRTEEAKELMGNMIAESKTVWTELTSKALLGGVQLLEIIMITMAKVGAAIDKPFVQAGASIAAFFKGIASGSTDIPSLMKRAWDQAGSDIDKMLQDHLVSIVSGFGHLTDAAQEAGDAVTTAAAEMDAAMASADEEAQKLALDFSRAAEKIAQDYKDKIAKSALDAGYSRTDALRKLNDDLAKIDQQASDNRVKIILDYQTQEVRLREDHARRLHDMENQYLFDLQDAVRDRDARKILDLERRYNLEKSKENENYAVSHQRAQQDFQRRLADEARQAAIQRAARIQQYNLEIRDINEQQRRRDLALDADRAKALEDAKKAEQQALEDWLLALTKTNGWTAEKLDEFLGIWSKRLGPDSPLIPMLTGARNFVVGQLTAMVTGAVQAINAYESAIRSLGVAGGVGAANTAAQTAQPLGFQYGLGVAGAGSLGQYASPVTPTARSLYGGITRGPVPFQYGGDFVATQPQVIQVGEVPERVQITPMGMASSVMGGGGGGGRRGGGKVEVLISLTEGLVGQVINQAMNEVADAVVSLRQAEVARQGAGGRR